MHSPWTIYSILWQNGDLLTTQQLNSYSIREDQIRELIFNQYYGKNQWGISNLSLNTTALPEGIITLEAITCVFPNGKPFLYNSNWKNLNGEEYINNEKNLIYPITINLMDHSMILTKVEEAHIGLYLPTDSFGHEESTILVESQRDYNDVKDINPVAYRVPKVTLAIGEIIKGYNNRERNLPNGNNMRNFLPLMKIKVQNGIFKSIPYQYPIVLLNKRHLIGEIIEELVEFIYSRIGYIKNDRFSEKFRGLIQCLMGHITLINSALKTQDSHPMQMYHFLLKLLGDIEGFGEFNLNHYSYDHNQLFNTFKDIIEAIKTLLRNIYDMGTIYNFLFNEGLYQLSQDLHQLTNRIVYLNFHCNSLNLEQLTSWVEESIICTVPQLEDNKREKNRGINRDLVNSYSSAGNLNIAVKYSIDLSQLLLKENSIICIFNPKPIDNLKVTLIIEQ